MITLRSVTSKNVWEIYELEADENLVASNPMSFTEAYFYYLETGNNPITLGIYHKEAPVGFMMIAYNPDFDIFDNKGAPYYYLWRLMIDEAYQSKGYGRKAMELLIDEIKSFKWGTANAIYTSLVPASDVTPKFYGSFGFEKTGEMDDDEIVVRLAL